MDKVSIDERGRVAIPKRIREKYNFRPGEEFEIKVKNDKIILKMPIHNQKKVKRSKEWDDKAFLKAGKSTFGD